MSIKLCTQTDPESQWPEPLMARRHGTFFSIILLLFVLQRLLLQLFRHIGNTSGFSVLLLRHVCPCCKVTQPTCTHVPGANMHTRAPGCVAMHATRTHKHTHTRMGRVSKLFALVTYLKVHPLHRSSTWQSPCINSFYTSQVNILKGICTTQPYGSEWTTRVINGSVTIFTSLTVL